MVSIKNMTLRTKLVVGGLIMVLLPMLGMGIVSTKTAAKAIEKTGKGQVSQVADDLAAMTELFLEEEFKFAKELSSDPQISDIINTIVEKGVEGSMEKITLIDKRLMNAFKNIEQNYESLFITDMKGNIITDSMGGSLREKKINIKDRDYFIAGKSGKTVIGKPIASRATGNPVVVVSIPLKTLKGYFFGVFGMVLKLDTLSNKLASIKIGDTGYPYMVNAEGIIIVHPNKDFLFKLDLKSVKGMERLTERMMAGESGVEEYVFKEKYKIAGFAPIKTTGWSIGVAQDLDEFLEGVHDMMTYNLIIAAITSIIVFIIIFVSALYITKPINAAVKGLEDISEGDGDLTKRLEVSSKDEIGMLSVSFNAFIDKLHKMIKDITQGVETLSLSATELSTISGQMTTGAEQTAKNADAVSVAAEEMTSNMTSASAAMEQSSTNLNSVTTAAEEMNATINEIAKNAEQARAISDSAVLKVSDSTAKMNQLGEAAQAIGKVVETITEISEQVNLLSLNATIEAARAGEAGKGFAVVANEIKELAKQTSVASMEIKEKIEDIQKSSSSTLSGIGEISKVIQEVNEIISTIATAVEEQSLTTREIVENIAQASTGVQEVNENVGKSAVVADEITKDIENVNISAGEMAQKSHRVNESSESLSTLAGELGEMVGRFKI
ncbi:Methyl-accepting chemotaxis sensory transducer with Cache sensor [Desulfamplus magnetovallimortis]|uniref:Methyl-accepting chemotaxis sensory transducer with Cache sensor n=1 Tax=Desulfamplus magnetovallimortis TaxID=1246637 RepID=A0A1W1HIP4_9BACT|nr:methyl-accepting chemotaxis protein [Desulfamplus magnetovallimortis]SLM32344.1 Methyl-accepting chemotaxis sensory transducer with Cache sensor [Desulfamplus magnetovallimortis]